MFLGHPPFDTPVSCLCQKPYYSSVSGAEIGFLWQRQNDRKVAELWVGLKLKASMIIQVAAALRTEAASSMRHPSRN